MVWCGGRAWSRESRSFIPPVTHKLSGAVSSGTPRGIRRVRNGHIAQAHVLLPQMVVGWAVLVSAALPGSFPPQIVQVTQVPET